MIKLEKVNKYFYRHKKNQIHVINNTTLELGNTGLVALLGPSGCGKTTLLNAIGGLDKVSNGKIFINDKKITNKRSGYVDKVRNLNIGYIFQDYCLVDNMTVFENVALVLKINGIKNKEEIKKRVYFVLEKVGMYRYRNRFASMLSGGERQRVGIARAIVKDPSIIIADEPTGNLDSKNTLEVMNIIKAISKDRLVILVTHETELADFYASRILDIKDGTIVADRTNDHTEDLDYRLDGNIYLKDFKNHHSLEKDNVDVNYYSDTKEKLTIDIVVQNGNIYIKTKNNDKIEIVDDDSAIEFVDGHYKKISKNIYETYDFDFEKIDSKNVKKKYTSIFNPITLLINGFRKVRDYSFVKKLLLLGFFASGLFIFNAVSNALGVAKIEDNDFISVNRNYLSIVAQKINVNDYLSYEKNELVDYIIPGDSLVSFKIKFENYYQTYYLENNISGSLSSNEMITKSDIVKGTYPKNRGEIVLDRLVITKFFKESAAKQAGIVNEDELIGKQVYISEMKPFTIVGIVDKKDPSIYTDKSDFVNILYMGQSSYNTFGYDVKVDTAQQQGSVIDYELMEGKCKLRKGRWPRRDYEVVINYEYKDQYKINKYVDTKVNGQKLKVVGYYTSSTQSDLYLVTNSTVKYDLIKNSKNMSLYSTKKTELIDYLRENSVNVQDTYTRDKAKYLDSTKDFITTCIVVCIVTLIISLIEIYLMVRSSFLSRIKEVGIFRAIGMKKRDIKKMFLGEIIAITTIASVPGVLLMSYIVKQLKTIKYFQGNYEINVLIIIAVILFIYLFNIFIGLMPVKRVLRQTPAKILSRSDLE